MARKKLPRWKTALAECLALNDIKKRCLNPKHKSFKYYGGRGITVCSRWLDPAMGYANFISDMGYRPSSKHSIDRIDNHGNYEPSNCRWATVAQQVRNKRNNHFVTLNGETLTTSEWSVRLGIHLATLQTRLRNGWGERALLEPVNKRYSRNS